MRKFALAVLAACLLACSGGDDSEEVQSRNDAESEAPTDDDVGKDDPDTSGADQAIADAAVLKLSDFEPGWRADPPDEDDGPEMTDVCDGFDMDESAKADSKKFVRDDAEIENTVAVFTSEAEAEEFIATYGSDETADCVRDFMNEQVRKSMLADPDAPDLDDVTVNLGQASVGDYGDEAAAYQMEISVEASGFAIDFYIDAILVRSGRALALFTFADISSPLEEPREDVIASVLGRLDRELSRQPG